jgi:hypothetical protein
MEATTIVLLFLGDSVAIFALSMAFGSFSPEAKSSKQLGTVPEVLFVRTTRYRRVPPTHS